MATQKSRANPINIAPFVDVLLILFVILVVVARFDGVEKAKEYISKNEILQKNIVILKKDIKILDDKLREQLKKNTTKKSKLKEPLNKDIFLK
jgi:biopolymer transport protein ExbD